MDAPPRLGLGRDVHPGLWLQAPHHPRGDDAIRETPPQQVRLGRLVDQHRSRGQNSLPLLGIGFSEALSLLLRQLLEPHLSHPGRQEGRLDAAMVADTHQKVSLAPGDEGHLVIFSARAPAD
jgi:hypothetical protein